MARRLAILSGPGGESSRIRAIAKEVLISEDEFYDAARDYREKFGVDLAKRIELNPNSMFRPYPEVRKVLEYLSKKHSLGVIANQHRNVRKHLEKTWDLSRFFKFMILSEEVGYKKPDTEIFQLALDKARIEPSDAWMIGDRLDTDVAPAKSLGMNTIRVLHDSEFSIISADGEDTRPDFQFKDMKPLLNLF